MQFDHFYHSIIEHGQGEVIADEDRQPVMKCGVAMAIAVEDAPDRGTDQGNEEDETDDEIIVRGIARTVGKDGDRLVEERLGEPRDEAMKGLDPPVGKCIGEGQGSVKIEEEIEGEEEKEEAAGSAKRTLLRFALAPPLRTR